ncbi:MAG: divalent metal cation transporter [Cyclobacteriaceae bacterium]|nr:divalent metal cation transporter [Cyclobacteriaceae bacterium]
MNSSKFLKALGPGILFASTCIGVSHLVQSTRAGALYGFAFLGAIIMANVFKYPFFEFASRYTGSTGKSIINGYAEEGKWVLVLYLLITVPSMFTVTAAVTFVTSGLSSTLFGFELPYNGWSALLLGFCISVLAIGRYKILDNLLKLVGIVLVLTTLTAFISVLINGRTPQVSTFVAAQPLSIEGIIFLIALMGWMPTAVDISTWTSLWAEAKIKTSGYRPTMKETLADFNLGYWISAVLAICFLTLGAYVMYGTGQTFVNSAGGFAGQLIDMFTSSIGQWSYWFILIAAFSAMFSTTITVIDGYTRAIQRTTFLLINKNKGKTEGKSAYIFWALLVGVGGYFVVAQFLNNLKQLVDFATIVSFVIALPAAYLNYHTIFSNQIPLEDQPSKIMKILAQAGMVFLGLFTGLFFIIKLNPTLLEKMLSF